MSTPSSRTYPEIRGTSPTIARATVDFPDPDGFFRGLLRLDWPFYRDDDILELLDRGRSLRDQGERMRVYHEVDHRWVGEQAAILPIANSTAKE